MKIWKKFLISVITGALLFGLSVSNVFAAEQTGPHGYTYRVTIYAGNQGVFDGSNSVSLNNKNATVTQTEDKIVISGLNYGDELAFTAQADVKLTSAKYYVQGIRLGGRDNDAVAASVFIVKGDADYVVAYGIKGNQVSYTVNYHDEYGNEMLPSETYYGNVGDKPVIACKYVDGYMPQASGLTKTLKENAAENVLVFIYKPIPDPAVEDVVTTVTREEYVDVVVGGTQITGGTTGGGNGAGQTGVGGQGEENTGDNENAGTQGGTDTPGTTDTPGGNEQPGSQGENDNNEENDAAGDNNEQEDDLIIDLDDEDVPLANANGEANGQQNSTMLKYMALTAAAVIALAILVGIVAIRKKREDSAEEA